MISPGVRMRVASKQRVLEYRYELYCRAHDAYERGARAEVAPLHALALRCRRTAEMIAMAELLVENRYPRLKLEHIGAHHATCTDCLRPACLSADELAGATAQEPRRLIA